MVNNKTLIIKEKANIFVNRKSDVMNYYWCKQENFLLRIIRKYNLPFGKLFYGVWKNKLNDYDVVILFDSLFYYGIPQYIKKKNKDIKIIYWYWNPSNDEKVNKIKKDKYIDEIWTYNRFDAEKYDLKYNPQMYSFSEVENIKKNWKPENDVVFLGLNKGRKEKLENIKEILKKQNVKCDLHVLESGDSYMQYNEYLNLINNSKCILDFNFDLPCGLTLRPLEALFMEKKLITNNDDIVNYRFYNKNNIFIIGKDDWNNIYNFINEDYNKIDKEIIEYYDYKSWLDRMSR